MRRDRVDVAWAAGFYEGEGSLGSVSSRSLHIVVSQVDLEPLERLQAVFHRGRLTGPHDPHPPGKKLIYRWMVTGIDALRVMRLLYPHLSARRQRQFDEKFEWAQGRSLVANKDRTRCPQGHSYSTSNTLTDQTGRRHCRACGNERRTRAYWSQFGLTAKPDGNDRLSESGRQRIRETASRTHRGREFSPEHRARLGEAMARRWARGEVPSRRKEPAC